MARRVIPAAKTLALGGASFWVPDVLVHAVAGPGFDAAAVLMITVFLPTGALLTFALVDATGTWTVRGWPRAFLMLAGIWISGPTFMMLGATFGGAGFFSFSRAADWLMLLNVPAGTFIAATYDGSLGALLLVTLLLPPVAWLRARLASKDAVQHGAA